MSNIQFKATRRDAQGTGASRRLRRAGQLPGIIYGGGDAVPITLDHNELYHLLRRDVFHSSILDIVLDGKKETAVVRDTQWHPFKPQVLHIDFQRVAADEEITMRVPINLVGIDDSPAVKLGDSMISSVMTEIEIRCLPKDLPEAITVDVSHLDVGQSTHLSEIQLPDNVTLIHHSEVDLVVATALRVGGAEEEEVEDVDIDDGAAPTTGEGEEA